MTFPSIGSPIRAILTLALAGFAGACGSGKAPSPVEVAGSGIPSLPSATATGTNSSKALSALSITGSAGPQTGDPREAAMRCAIALRTFSREIEDYPALVGDGEKEALTKAQGIYDQRVAAEAAKQGVPEQETRSEMEQGLQLALDDPAPQIKRVTDCLRQLAGQPS